MSSPMARSAGALLVVLTLSTGAPPPRAGAQVGAVPVPPEPAMLSEAGQAIDTLFDLWQFEEGARALSALRARDASAPEVAYLEGYELYLRGDYAEAVARLRALEARHDANRAPSPRAVTGLRALAEAAGSVVDGHAERRSANFRLRYPPEDEVLVEPALEALEAALARLREDLGFSPAWPIVVDIYRSAEDLATVSPLTLADVERTGTIALCKWGRLMATTPRALRFGYPWLDTLSHELVHYAVSALTRDRTPVWLQEGFAKFMEARWRDPAAPPLPPSLEHLLAKALKKGRLIGFEAMHPSMAKLPNAEDAALAFAEVASAVALLHERGGFALLREILARVQEGADAPAAVASALGQPWASFDAEWRAYMKRQGYRTFPDFEPIAPRLRKPGAARGKRGPSEDEAAALPDTATQMLRLGNMLLVQGRPRAAALQYEKGARKARPGDWLFPVKLGRTYLALQEPDRALGHVAHFAKLYPELPWPQLIAGRAHLLRGDLDAARDALDAALGNNPFDPEVHCSLEEVYRRMGPLAPRLEARREHARRFCQALGR